MTLNVKMLAALHMGLSVAARKSPDHDDNLQHANAQSRTTGLYCDSGDWGERGSALPFFPARSIALEVSHGIFYIQTNFHCALSAVCIATNKTKRNFPLRSPLVGLYLSLVPTPNPESADSRAGEGGISIKNRTTIKIHTIIASCGRTKQKQQQQQQQQQQ
jgi:hypothetical protein